MKMQTFHILLTLLFSFGALSADSIPDTLQKWFNDTKECAQKQSNYWQDVPTRDILIRLLVHARHHSDVAILKQQLTDAHLAHFVKFGGSGSDFIITKSATDEISLQSKQQLDALEKQTLKEIGFQKVIESKGIHKVDRKTHCEVDETAKCLVCVTQMNIDTFIDTLEELKRHSKN